MEDNVKNIYIHTHIYIYIHIYIYTSWASLVVIVLKNPPANAGDIRNACLGWIPGLERYSEGGYDNTLQCLLYT